MYVRRGLGDDSAGFDLSAVTGGVQSALASDINIGGNTVPLWAAGSVVILAYLFLQSLKRGASRVKTKVSTRAKKIHRGFTK